MSATLDSVGVLDGSTYVTARAWVNFIGVSVSINSSYNVSSVSRRAQGRWTVNLSSSLVDRNYVVGGVAGSNYNGGSGNSDQGLKLDDSAVTPTASAVPITNVGSAFLDSTITTCIVYR
jgi:hypothetical protein